MGGSDWTRDREPNLYHLGYWRYLEESNLLRLDPFLAEPLSLVAPVATDNIYPK